MRALIALSILVGSSTYADFKPMKVRAILIGMEACIYAQAQSLANQMQAGLDHVTVSSGDSETFDQYLKNLSDDSDSEFAIDDKTSQLTPEIPLSGSWQKGDCEGHYGSIGYPRNDSTFAIYKDRYCPSSEEDENASFMLLASDGSVPAVTYRNSDRTQVYDNDGERSPLKDVIANLTLVPVDPALAKVQLVNSDTNHVANVYFDAATYTTCLKKKLGL